MASHSDAEPLKLFICTDFETDWARGAWQRIAGHWRDGASPCLVVDDHASADAILMTLTDPKAPYAASVDQLRDHPLWKARRDSVFVYDTADQTAGLFPGLYASLRRSLFSTARHRTGCYIQSFNEYVDLQPVAPRPPLLASFQGNFTSPPRARIFALPSRRPDVVIERTEPFWAAIGDEKTSAFKRRYADLMGRSRFVLCPRGNGTSSYRLFEAMQSGRVPVVISDAWVPCAAIPWDTCSLRVRERDVAHVFDICERHDQRWPEMASAARRVWEEWFGPRGLARLIAFAVRDIRRTRRLPEACYASAWPARSAMLNARALLVRGKIRGLHLLARMRPASTTQA
jgi:hypothetical protein